MAPLKYQSFSIRPLKVKARITSESVPMPKKSKPMVQKSKCGPRRLRKRAKTATAKANVTSVERKGK